MRKKWGLAMLATVACVLPNISAYAGSNMLIISEGDQGLFNWAAQQWGTGRVIWTGQAGAPNQELIPVGGLLPQDYSYEGGGTVIFGNNTSLNLSALVGNQNKSTGTVADALPEDKMWITKKGVQNVAMGFYNKQQSYLNTAIGQDNTQTGAHNLAAGYRNTTGWTDASAVGMYNRAVASKTLAMGVFNTVDSPYAVAVGNYNQSDWLTSFAERSHFPGAILPKMGVRSITLGSQNANTGLDGIVVGNTQRAVAPQSISIGSYGLNAGISSVAIGTGVLVGTSDTTQLQDTGSVVEAGAVNRAVALGAWSGARVSDAVALGSYANGNTNSGAWGYSPDDSKVLTGVGDTLPLMNRLTGEVPPAPYAVQQLENARQAAVQQKEALSQAQSELRQATANLYQNKLEGQAYEDALAKEKQAVEKVRTLQAAWEETQSKLAPLSAWYSTLGAVAVGDAAHGITRQITGVAAGTNNTDAVNVAQLKALAFRMKAVNYLNANNTYQRTDIETALLNAMKMASNTQTESGALAEGAIALGAYANVTERNGIALGRYATVTGANDVAIGYGATNGREVWTSGTPKEAFTGIAWNPAQGTVSFGNSAQTLTLDDGSTVPIPAQTRRLRYVAGGIQPTDAVNISQLTALAKMVGVTPADVEKNINTPGAQSIYDQVKANSAAIGSNAAAIKQLQERPVTQPTPQPAPPAPAPQPVDTGWTISAATAGADTSSVVHAGDTVRWKGDQNVTVTLTPDTTAHRDAMVVTMSDTPIFKTVTVQGNTGSIVIDGNTGIQAGHLKIQGVADGEINNRSNDAVNGSQIAKINAANDVRFNNAEKGIQANATQIGKNKTDIEANKAAIGDNKKNLDQLKTMLKDPGADATQQMHQQIEAVARDMEQHISDAGSMAAAMAAMSPLPYRPGDKGQMMAGVGHYGTSTAVALGYAQYANPDVLWRGGMSYANSKHLMWNAGITWRVGLSQQTEAKRRDAEAKTDWKEAYEALATDYGKLAQENQKQKEEIAYIMGILQRHHLT